MFRVIDSPALARPRGYANGMLYPASGAVLFVAGQIGWDADERIPEGAAVDVIAPQFEQALRNVVTVVREAGGRPEHIGRLTVYVTDKHAYVAARREIGQAYRRVMGKHYPAMALVQVAALLDDRAVVEVEATAVLPAAPGHAGVSPCP
jgi:enamine deaminase RidA (YjgF/YER057c/UK114 family)